MVVGWARSHYLSSTVNPSIKGDRLLIPHERQCISGSWQLAIRIGWSLTDAIVSLSVFFLSSLDLAIRRLKEQEASNKKPSENMKVVLVLSFYYKAYFFFLEILCIVWPVGVPNLKRCLHCSCWRKMSMSAISFQQLCLPMKLELSLMILVLLRMSKRHLMNLLLFQ